MSHPPLQAGWIDRPHRRFELGDLPLESGETLRDAFVSYVVHGDESRLHDAPVLLATAIGSTHHRLDFLIGDGLAFDPARRCVVVVDALGNGLSSSPSNSVTQGGADFPRIAIRDMVESQRRLLDGLGIGRLAAVGGASMGGMQALQWAVSHPGRMEQGRRHDADGAHARAGRSWSTRCRGARCSSDAACRVPRPRAEAMRLWLPLTQLVMPRTPRALDAFGSREAMLDWLDGRGSARRRGGPRSLRLEVPDAGLRRARRRRHRRRGRPGHDRRRSRCDRRALAGIAAEVLVLAPALDLYNPAVRGARPGRARSRGRASSSCPATKAIARASGIAAEPTDAVLQATIRAFLG